MLAVGIPNEIRLSRFTLTGRKLLFSSTFLAQNLTQISQKLGISR